ncbi:MAG: VCBS domain-containing protein, partial [Nitratireductor sp.]
AILGRVDSDGDKWVVTSLSNEAVRIGKTGFDLLEDKVALDELRDVVSHSLGDRTQLDGANSFDQIAFDSAASGRGDGDSNGNGDDGNNDDKSQSGDTGADKDDPPIAADDAFTVNEDTILAGSGGNEVNVINGSGGGLDIDPDGFAVTVTQVNGQDLTFVGNVASVVLPSGAILLISQTGNITYDGRAIHQYLAINETALDSFTYTIEDQNGYSDTATVTITIEGLNDSPIIQILAGDSAAESLVETNSPLAVSGTLTLIDVDVSDAVNAVIDSVTIDPASTGPSGSHPDNATLKAMLTLSESLIIETGSTNGTITWNFNSDVTADNHLNAFDYLADGETLILNYVVVRAIDTSGAGSGDPAGNEPEFDSQVVTITITGTNDQPVIDAITATGALSEASGTGNGTAEVSATGTIVISDLDDTDEVTLSEVSNNDMVWSGGTITAAQLSPVQIQALVDGFVLNNTGALAIDDTTNTVSSGWTYTTGENLNFLGEGETLTFSYEVTATDDSGTGTEASQSQTVVITITGTNDQPVIDAITATGALSEASGTGNGTAEASAAGTIVISDLDDTDEVTLSEVSNNDMVWSGGTITADQLSAAQIQALVDGFVLNNTGALAIDDTSNTVSSGWTYSTTENLNFLAEGETLTFSYEVTATDDSGIGTAASQSQTVTITITGTNDQPVIDAITATAHSAGIRYGQWHCGGPAAGTILISDLDDTDQVTLSEVSNNDMVWSGGTITADQLSAAQIRCWLTASF